jgi:hypothetical protein
MRGDGRSRRVALVSDRILNPPEDSPDTLAAMVADGWGVIGLPPAALGSSEARAWVDGAVDQARELARHGMTVVAVLDPGDAVTTALLERSLAAAPALAVPALVAAAPDSGLVARFLDDHRPD